MCGIAGIWRYKNNIPHDVVVKKMLDAMAHRGPDGRGMLTFQGGSAGVVRLALVDLTTRGQQPIWSADKKTAILFNGEMYNFREERSRLKANGYPFYSETDTEVVLALYLEKGLDFVRYLRGMYALAVFDWRDTPKGVLPILILARDPLGIKPLYISRPRSSEYGIIFSSEIKALLASRLVDKTLDKDGLADYFSYGFVLQPKTIIAGIRMIEPGYMEIYRPDRSVQKINFWKMPDFKPHQETFFQAADRLHDMLETSIKIHSLADAPVGVFLSKGIDSTLITAIMRKYIPDLHTYTLRIPESALPDESKEAAAFAHTLGCGNTIVEITGNELTGLLPKFAFDIDQPSTDGLNTWLISKGAARDVKAVISGIGGDELFSGYPVTNRMEYRYNTISRKMVNTIIGKISEPLEKTGLGQRLGWYLYLLAMKKSPLTTWITTHTVFPRSQAYRLIGLEGKKQASTIIFTEALNEISGSWQKESGINLSCLLDTSIYLRSQLLRDVDAASMAFSLEMRTPLVDIDIADFSFTCEDNFKLRTKQDNNLPDYIESNKYVLRHILNDLVPNKIATYPKSHFTLPYEKWIKGPLQPIVEDTCDPGTLSRRGVIDPRMAAPLYRNRKSGASDIAYPKLWALMIFELWCRAVLDT